LLCGLRHYQLWLQPIGVTRQTPQICGCHYSITDVTSFLRNNIQQEALNAMLPLKSAGRVHTGGMHRASLPHSISASSRLCNWYGQSRVSAQSNIAAVTTSGSSEPRSAVAHLCASALAAAMFGLAPAAHAIGPVSVKLNDITLTRVECSGACWSVRHVHKVSTCRPLLLSPRRGKQHACCWELIGSCDP